jgi:uncharacterized protein
MGLPEWGTAMSQDKSYIKYWIAFILLLLTWSPTHAATTEKVKDIAALMKMTGATKMADQLGVAIVTQMMASMKQQPNIPAKALQITKEETIRGFKRSIPALMKSLLPIYDKHFTHQEIRDLISFYKTRTGQKALKVLPLIIQDSMVLGQRHSQKVMPKIVQRIQTRFKEAGIK